LFKAIVKLGFVALLKRQIDSNAFLSHNIYTYYGDLVLIFGAVSLGLYLV
jgi:hypothetical protein